MQQEVNKSVWIKGVQFSQLPECWGYRSRNGRTTVRYHDECTSFGSSA
ncbi:MAG: hypothetical protein HFI75_14685 [Lachnospiraceae bacterium]|nr:hypothetical protein [Lachnospiraceae bacterium]